MAKRRGGDDYDEPRNPPRTVPIAPAVEPPSDIPSIAETRDRVAWIVDRMRDLSWPVWPASLRFRQRIAEAWGISESTVRNYTAEAHRVVELDAVDRAQVAQDIARQLDAVAQDALASVNEVTGLPDYPSVIRALESKAKFLGAEPSKEVKLSGTVSLASIDELRKAVGDDGEAEGRSD